MESTNDIGGARESLLGNHKDTDLGLTAFTAETTDRVEDASAEVSPRQKSTDIPNDTFSMLYASRCWQEYPLPISVTVVQMTILVLATINLLEHKLIFNPWKIPPDVPPSVKISQIIAIIVFPFTADDLFHGIVFFGKSLTHSIGEEQGFSMKWELTNLLRLIEGAFVLFVTFILIVQSKHAIDLWLNFAGITFVSLLDDTAYTLAANNFFGQMAKGHADRVSNIKFRRPIDSNRGLEKKIGCGVRSLLISGVAAALLISLSVVMVRQHNQEYSCRSISVMVKEGEGHNGRYYAGTYQLKTVLDGRAVYIQDQGKGKRGGLLAYCKKERRWVLTGRAKIDLKKLDACEGREYGMVSEMTESYDITEVTDLLLYGGEEANMYIRCNDCNQDHDCVWGTCNKDTRICNCAPNTFGQFCDFAGPCTEIWLDEGFGEEYGFEKSLHLLKHEGEPVMVYNRHVWAQKLLSGALGFIMFDGGRWVVYTGEADWDWNETKEILAKYLEKDFDGKNYWYSAVYVSDPSDLGTPTEVPFREWLTDGSSGSSIGRLGDEEYHAFCADCADAACAENDSLCPARDSCFDRSGSPSVEICEQDNEVYRCNCDPGFMGAQCQIRPAEGTMSLYFDNGAGGCSTCRNHYTYANEWNLWHLDGINNTCLHLPQPLAFERDHGILKRDIGLSLNDTHFAVFVSIKNHTACAVSDGEREMYSISRNYTGRRININLAVSMSKGDGSFGEIVDPEQVECQADSLVHEYECDNNLMKVSGGSSLEYAWLVLDFQITPNV